MGHQISYHFPGDLGEMVIYQGPMLGANMELGAAGFWNNTMRPHDYYLKSSKIGYLDATRAEIIGDIDGTRVYNASLLPKDQITINIYLFQLNRSHYCKSHGKLGE